MSDSRGAGVPAGAMTRGEAIRWLAWQTAKLGAAGGAALIVAEAWPARTGAAVPKGVQVFRSRPDLRPPTITVDVAAGPTTSSGLIVTESHLGPGQEGPLLFDDKGELVWFLPLSPRGTLSRLAINVKVQTYRGEPVLTWFEGALVNGHGQGHYVLYDTTYRQVGQVHAANGYMGDLHEFVLTDEGTALLTCYGTATADLSAYGGKAHGSYYYGVVQEIDMATGRLLFEWRSDRHVPLDESYLRVGQTAGHAAAPWDYFHVNSVCVDPTDGNLIVSARNTWTVYKLERKSGKVLWRMGGKASDFHLPSQAHFAFQHDARRWPDGLLTIFDDEAGPPAEASQSRGIVLSIDEAKRTGELVAEYRHHPPLLADSQGSVQMLAKGHRFICWGMADAFTEYDATGRVVFDARMAPQTESYRAFKHEWSGRPARPPDMAAQPTPGGVTVYASWNGATDVDRWRVMGGPSASSLHPVAIARRSGFETAIAVPHRPVFLAVDALDSRGRHLGRSAVGALTGASAARPGRAQRA